MDARALIAELARRRVDAFFLVARRFPAEKLDVSPGGKARTPLDMAQEVGVLAHFYAEVVETGEVPPFDAGSMDRMRTAMHALPDLDAAEAACRAGTDRLLAALDAADDAALARLVVFPWDPTPYTLAAMAANHVWNLGYHEGQLHLLLALTDE